MDGKDHVHVGWDGVRVVESKENDSKTIEIDGDGDVTIDGKGWTGFLRSGAVAALHHRLSDHGLCVQALAPGLDAVRRRNAADDPLYTWVDGRREEASGRHRRLRLGADRRRIPLRRVRPQSLASGLAGVPRCRAAGRDPPFRLELLQGRPGRERRLTRTF